MQHVKRHAVKSVALAATLFALIAGFWMATVESAEALPTDPPCIRFCNRMYDQCIADGWAQAECEMKRQQCLAGCE
jgi:hypothetical protein